MKKIIIILFAVFIVSILIFSSPSPTYGIIFENGIIITNPTPEVQDEFGFSVAYDKKSILIGAGGDTVGSSDTGAVYLYDENGVLQMKFLNPTPTLDPETNELFGHIVSISDNNVVITARHDDTVGWRAGAAYIFDIISCDDNLSNKGEANDSICETPVHTLTNPESPREIFGFGVSSSISENYALIGIPIAKPTEKFGGGAYLFDITKGNLLQTFQNPTPIPNDQFGHWVSMSGNNILIGARNDDIGAKDAGAVYLFDAVTGDLVQTFQNPTPEAGDQFGFSVAMSGNNILIGAIGDDIGAKDAGAVYLFLENIDGICKDGTELVNGICQIIKSESEPDSGCLIVTAAYGTELAPQIQLLREIRDNILFSTTSGTSFMLGFNTLYYSFAPTIADWERGNPMFKETVKILITPMLSTLSIMSLVNEGSEVGVLGFGISIIVLNFGIYIAIPVLIIIKIRKSI